MLEIRIIQKLLQSFGIFLCLVLVSQVQRSGGTLLSQLFDGHPQCHAHPWELHIGRGGKLRWPRLRLDDPPDAWFDVLRESPTERLLVQGYSKPGVEQLDSFPFLLSPAVQYRLFLAEVARHEIRRPRDVLDCYMTSYFNAWLDNQNLYGEDKRWVTAFGARTVFKAPNREAFFADYPDGRLIGIIRDPAGWYASASRYQPDRYGDVEEAMALWRQSAEALLAAREQFGDQVYLLSFERLVSETEATMADLTRYLDIDRPPIATVPTFNCRPIRANSSFDVARHGVLAEPGRRGDALAPDVRDAVTQLAGDLYERALAAVAVPG